MVSVLRMCTAGRRAVRLAEAVAERAAGRELRRGHQGDAGGQLQEPEGDGEEAEALGKFRKNDIQGVCLQQACILKHCEVT